ncbi:Mid2 domain protein [Rhizoctonia solani 123E]|uniref:Mid2 domain protein n=1 Tax=Rhizoctonia solani 123E TaxID=1423351 RepID=A0A074ST26_9AGAM|nr:Mid2 domain protein [Rhizoctonia solani 123E]
MFAPDRNVDRNEMDLAGDDVDDPEAIARPYHLPPSPTRNEMAMSTSSRPLSAQSHGPTLAGQYDDAGASYYTQPGSGMGMHMPMPMPMPMSRDHMAHTHSRANSTLDHTEPTTTSEGGSSSARLMKEREARRLHVANDDGGVIVHSDGGRVDEEASDEAPREIPPTYESIGGPSGPR